MKKTILKLLSGAIMLSTLGASIPAMALDSNPANFEKENSAEESFQTSEIYWFEEALNLQRENAIDIQYDEEDDAFAVTPWFDGIPGAPVITLASNQDENGEEESDLVIESLSISEV